MSAKSATEFGEYLKRSRTRVGISRTALAKAADIERTKISRFESGSSVPDLAEAARLALVLKIPVEQLLSGRWRPHTDLRGIALELFHLGVCDLEIVNPRVPGAFRRKEQILALVLKGDRPDPRIVDAIPFVLSIREFNVPLTLAFADLYDNRIGHRLAWLSDVALFLSKQSSSFPVDLKSERQLSQFIRAAKKPKRPDSLGHPSSDSQSIIWRRWNVNYAGTLQTFKDRTEAVWAAYQQAHTSEELGE